MDKKGKVAVLDKVKGHFTVKEYPLPDVTQTFNEKNSAKRIGFLLFVRKRVKATKKICKILLILSNYLSSELVFFDFPTPGPSALCSGGMKPRKE